MATRTDTNSISRFDDRADDYIRYRPGYPPEAIQTIVEGLHHPSRPVAADVGAGTGISARLLGDRGLQVVAIEPGAAMRRAALPHPNVTWMAGTAEAMGLRAGAVDLVLSAQSFHWFRPDAALAEFARILGPGGRLAIMWNRRSTTDPLTVGYRQAMLEAGGDLSSESPEFDPALVAQSQLFTEARRFSFPNPQRLDLDGLIGRARSASYAPKAGAAGQRLRELLSDLYQRHADAEALVTMRYETEIFASVKR